MSKTRPIPPEIVPLVAAIVARAAPRTIWLFGSRARGDHEPRSDWDLAVGLHDDAPHDLLDPMTYWRLPKSCGVAATIIPALARDIADCWGELNTLGYDLARDGQILHVGQ